MARISELIGLGVPPLQATALGGMEKTAGATGAGTSSQANATALSTPYTRFTTVGSNTGARLPAASGQGPFLVVNAGANALLVYPASGEYINDGTVDTSFSVTNAKQALFWPVGNNWIAILSA